MSQPSDEDNGGVHVSYNVDLSSFAVSVVKVVENRLTTMFNVQLIESQVMNRMFWPQKKDPGSGPVDRGACGRAAEPAH